MAWRVWTLCGPCDDTPQVKTIVSAEHPFRDGGHERSGEGGLCLFQQHKVMPAEELAFQVQFPPRTGINRCPALLGMQRS